MGNLNPLREEVFDCLWVNPVHVAGVVPGELGAASLHSHLVAIFVDGEDVLLHERADDSSRDLHVDAVVLEVLDDAEVVSVAGGVLEHEGEDGVLEERE